MTAKFALNTIYSEIVLSHSVLSDCFATPWTGAHQAPLSMEFSRQEYWGELSFPTLGVAGIEPVFLVSPAIFITIPPGKPSSEINGSINLISYLFRR